MVKVKDLPEEKKRTNDGYESVIYLEEKESKQLYILRTWYQGASYKQALTSQADIIKSFENNEELIVVSGRLEGVSK